MWRSKDSNFVDFRAIKAAVTITQILEHYGLISRLKRSGDTLSGCCPIHGGTNSTQFRVSISKNCWNCFSDCKRGGNVLDFVALKENVSVREAAVRIADWFHLDVQSESAQNRHGSTSAHSPEHSGKGRSSQTRAKGDSQREPLAQSAEIGCNKPLGFSLQNLDPKHPYLTERGLTAETIGEFGLGYCAKGSMSGRIVIPIQSAESQLLAYAGRWPGEPPDATPKYKLPAGFKKSAELFNLHRAILEPTELPLIVVEGFFDAIKLWQNGAHKVVALMGSILSPAQEQLILKHTGSSTNLLLMFDEDDAGRFGREQMMLRLNDRRFVRIFKFDEEGKQPEHLTAEQLREFQGGAA